jgi:hypothetical protein
LTFGTPHAQDQVDDVVFVMHLAVFVGEKTGVPGEKTNH